MEWREKEEKLVVKRGKKVTLRVSTTSSAIELRLLAENKWKQFHPDLYDDHYKTFYTLLYENSTEIQKTLPGSSDDFTLQSYQHEIGKDYKRITFYLCKRADLIIRDKVNEIYGDNLDHWTDDEQDDDTSNNACPPNLQTEFGIPSCITSTDLPECAATNTNYANTEDATNGATKDAPNAATKDETLPDTLTGLLKELVENVNREGQFFFVIRRNAPLTRILTVWKREATKQGLSNHKLMIHFAGEDGIDDGALTRVFLTKAISGMSNMFPNGAPIDSMLHVQNGDYKSCGQIVAYSLTHGGPPPCFLHPSVIELLINDNVDKENLDINKNVTNEEKEFLQVIADNPSAHSSYIIDHGYTGIIDSAHTSDIIQTVMTSIITHRLCFLEEFKKGLKIFGVSDYLHSCSALLMPLFNVENQTHKSVDGSYIVSLLRPVYSEENSTRRQVEELMLDMLQDFLYDIESDKTLSSKAPMAWKDTRYVDDDWTEFEDVELTASGVLAWITGQSHKPIDSDGFYISVHFEHECYTKYPGHKICYPIVSSCARAITLPVMHMKSPTSFTETLYTAYCQGQAFSRQ